MITAAVGGLCSHQLCFVLQSADVKSFRLTKRRESEVLRGAHRADRSLEATAIHSLSSLQSSDVMSAAQPPYVRCSCMGAVVFVYPGARQICMTEQLSVSSYHNSEERGEVHGSLCDECRAV